SHPLGTCSHHCCICSRMSRRTMQLSYLCTVQLHQKCLCHQQRHLFSPSLPFCCLLHHFLPSSSCFLSFLLFLSPFPFLWPFLFPLLLFLFPSPFPLLSFLSPLSPLLPSLSRCLWASIQPHTSWWQLSSSQRCSR